MMLHTSPLRFALAVIVLSSICSVPSVAQTINEYHKILPKDGAEGDQFGESIAICGTTALVGASSDTDNGSFAGSAYLFDTTTGQQIAKLLPNDGTPFAIFGSSVAIDGATAIVGAPFVDNNEAESGSAYLFDTTTGEQIAKLLSEDGAPGDAFGRSVAISGTTAVVGAPYDDDNGERSGSAYLFDTTTGQQIAKLLPSDGGYREYFGFSVAISGNTVVVGAYWNFDKGLLTGSAYLFDTTTGQQIAKLVPSDGAYDDRFGWSVAISGNMAVIGAPYDDDHGDGSGSAYVFDTTTGQQIAKLLPREGSASDNFGYPVSISGNSVIAGVSKDGDNGDWSGSAYLFDAMTGQQIAKLLPSDGAEFDSFGFSVAASGSTVAVGAFGDNDNGNRSGSAYIFTTPTCAADFTGDGTLDFFDISAFLTAFNASNPVADFTSDGVFNFFDVSAFLTEFLVGCP